MFFSRTNRSISNKHAWGWGFRFVQIKGLAKYGKILINFQKSSSHEPLMIMGQNALIFSVNHPLGKGIQVFSNEVPRVMYEPAPGA